LEDQWRSKNVTVGWWTAGGTLLAMIATNPGYGSSASAALMEGMFVEKCIVNAIIDANALCMVIKVATTIDKAIHGRVYSHTHMLQAR